MTMYTNAAQNALIELSEDEQETVAGGTRQFECDNWGSVTDKGFAAVGASLIGTGASIPPAGPAAGAKALVTGAGIVLTVAAPILGNAAKDICREYYGGGGSGSGGGIGGGGGVRKGGVEEFEYYGVY